MNTCVQIFKAMPGKSKHKTTCCTIILGEIGYRTATIIKVHAFSNSILSPFYPHILDLQVQPNVDLKHSTGSVVGAIHKCGTQR